MYPDARLSSGFFIGESHPARLQNEQCCSDSAVDDVRLVCASCHRAYPIVDGIPALIVEQAETITGA